MQDVHHLQNEPVYATQGFLEPSLKRRRSVSVIDVSNQPTQVTFHRPKRTARSVSPSNSFRYILPFNSAREKKHGDFEATSLGNRQDVPVTITKSPMYSEGYL